MGDPLIDYLRSCCIQVLGEKPGCGFFIAPNLIVTCSHVVGREVENDTEIKYNRWNQESIKAKILGNFPTLDIAFLETNEKSNYYAPLSEDAQIDDRLTGLGFPKQNELPEFDQFTAQFESMTQLSNQGKLVKFKGGQVQPGYSGGPLLNLRTYRVMGVVNTTRDRLSDLGGWAIPASVIESLLKEKLPKVSTNWTDAQAKQTESRNIISLTPEQLR